MDLDMSGHALGVCCLGVLVIKAYHFGSVMGPLIFGNSKMVVARIQVHSSYHVGSSTRQKSEKAIPNMI